MLIFLYGPDSFRLQQRLRVLEDGFRTKFDSAGLSSRRLDGTQFLLSDFHSSVQTGGLFAEKRLCILTAVWELPSDDQAELAMALDRLPNDVIVVISGDAPPRKNNKLFKPLLQADTVEEYADLTGSALQQWVATQVKIAGASIEPAAVNLLMQRFGSDTWQLHFEIKKLAAYDAHITIDTINQFSSDPTPDNIFALTDALGAKNAGSASRILEDQIRLGNHPQYLITMLARHVAILAKIKKTNGRGLKLHPFVLEKGTQQARQFSAQQLEQLHCKLQDIDQSTKTSNQNTAALLDIFILDACR